MTGSTWRKIELRNLARRTNGQRISLKVKWRLNSCAREEICSSLPEHGRSIEKFDIGIVCWCWREYQFFDTKWNCLLAEMNQSFLTFDKRLSLIFSKKGLSQLMEIFVDPMKNLQFNRLDPLQSIIISHPLISSNVNEWEWVEEKLYLEYVRRRRRRKEKKRKACRWMMIRGHCWRRRRRGNVLHSLFDVMPLRFCADAWA